MPTTCFLALKSTTMPGCTSRTRPPSSHPGEGRARPPFRRSGFSCLASLPAVEVNGYDARRLNRSIVEHAQHSTVALRDAAKRVHRFGIRAITLRALRRSQYSDYQVV